MKIHSAAASGWYIGQKCPQCRRTIKTGDVIFSHSGAYRFSQKIAAHRMCVEKVFDEAEPDEKITRGKPKTRAEKVQEEFDALRDRLMQEHGAQA